MCHGNNILSYSPFPDNGLKYMYTRVLNVTGSVLFMYLLRLFRLCFMPYSTLMDLLTYIDLHFRLVSQLLCTYM